MKLEINIEKKAVLFLAVLVIGITIIGLVVAFTVNPGTVPNPGHALSTIQGFFDGDVSLEDSLGKLQQRVDETCPSGQAIRAISTTGSVTCQSVPPSALCTWSSTTYSTGNRCKTRNTTACSSAVPTYRNENYYECQSDGTWTSIGSPNWCGDVAYTICGQ